MLCFAKILSGLEINNLPPIRASPFAMNIVHAWLRFAFLSMTPVPSSLTRPIGLKDWTFIDSGTAIGQTVEIGRRAPGLTEAHWYFADPAKIAEHTRLKRILYDASVPLDDIHDIAV